MCQLTPVPNLAHVKTQVPARRQLSSYVKMACKAGNALLLALLASAQPPPPPPDTDLLLPQSDPHDGPRGLQHRDTPVEARRTWASLRFRGNWGMLTGGRGNTGVPPDLPDLTSHDLCAYARGPHRVTIGAKGPGWPHGEDGQGVERTIDGSMFREPSMRGVPPEESEWGEVAPDRSVTWGP